MTKRKLAISGREVTDVCGAVTTFHETVALSFVIPSVGWASGPPMRMKMASI
jgi:hypothetical protein